MVNTKGFKYNIKHGWIKIPSHLNPSCFLYILFHIFVNILAYKFNLGDVGHFENQETIVGLFGNSMGHEIFLLGKEEGVDFPILF